MIDFVFLPRTGWIQPRRALGMRRYDGNFIRVVAGQVCVDEYQDIGESFRERQSLLELCPGMRIDVQHNG